MTADGVKLLEFPQLGDERGHLIVCEGGGNVPFEIKRVFYIYGSEPGVVRGRHANERSEFVLINVRGKSAVRARDAFGGERVITLSAPHAGVYLPKMIWKDMYGFSADSILLVLASERYDAGEYIRDFGEFKKRGAALLAAAEAAAGQEGLEGPM